ncbi:MAG: asparagine synthase (glutamine-hydrolyzing) [Vicinamibacterales bacterium]
MCGIAGFVAHDGIGPDDRERLVRMRDVLTHRGPDDAGLYMDGVAALGHRRLSIVDVAGGRQPLSNETDTVWTVFNGEIYNHAELRAELQRAGHTYVTRSDTETLVHAYEEWGDACVERLRGMFAFAIWDTARQRLLLARDRLGIKPLYWARAGSRLVFGSEIKAILESGFVEARANEAALPELLAMRSLAGTRHCSPASAGCRPVHVLSFAGDRAILKRYWDVPAPPAAGTRSGSREDDTRRFRGMLEESIRLRLMSDVPLGVFLSGGIDSSAIAALMAPMVGRTLDTFSVAFADRAHNELASPAPWRPPSVRAHEIVIDDRDFFTALPRAVWHEDEPVAHPSSIPLHFVSALARRHVKVVLTGEGSDELLAGYGRYPRALLNWSLGAPTSTSRRPCDGQRAPARSMRPAGSALRAPVLPGGGPRARDDLLRQLRRHRHRAPAELLAAPGGRRLPRTAPTANWWTGSRGRDAAACSIACSTRT